MRETTAIRYVRFHAIFHDENGVYDRDAQGRPVYNFNYVDQIYDGLLENQVRPFVGFGFMPRKLSAEPPVFHPFWYRPVVSPPADYAKWGDLVRAFARHMIERYGIDEVAQWYFEVWNEPNIDFWAGKPHESTYYELYSSAANALKDVSPRLRRRRCRPPPRPPGWTSSSLIAPRTKSPSISSPPTSTAMTLLQMSSALRKP